VSDAGAGYRPPGTTARTVAQAKVNLALRVLAREVTGYHQLETLFCRLELGDDVVVRTDVRGRSIDCRGDVIPPAGLGAPERNLAWRAAAAYASATGWPNDFAVEITKRIPVGGGLGGGSADAGAVLRCLNALAPSPVPPDALVALAGPLGADVPFLSTDATLALGWGRGERLLALPPLPQRDVLLVTFPFGVSTPEAYGWLDAHTRVAMPTASALRFDALRSWAGVSTIAHNDFETVVAPRFAEIDAALTTLRAGATEAGDTSAFALLAGSGATVFLVSSALPSTIAFPHGSASRILRTRTAAHVVAVEVSG
jgi:4-diphosphocytidyl-2-C-methyl-D-erythritol kinase